MSATRSATRQDMLCYERSARAHGYRAIAGVDEVGRGPLAGPVVAAAVILPVGDIGLTVADSKTLTARRREALAAGLRAAPGVRIGLGVVAASRIDEINILQATGEAMRQALANLQPPPDYALVDGLPIRDFPLPASFIVKGDALSASIAAASIIAKVHRDALMAACDNAFPGYGFARHKGYGSREHLEALSRLGPCPEHRRSFAPVARCRRRDTQLELPWGRVELPPAGAQPGVQPP